MPRPCQCGSCRLCHLATHDIRYQVLWGVPLNQSLLARASRYASAAVTWLLAGRPVRSDEEVSRIYAQVCGPCDAFLPDKGTCGVCGCRVNKSRAGLVNKIRQATQHCPRKKW